MLTRSAKEALEHCFQGIGDVTAFEAWARDNRTEFYRLWGKLIPKEIVGAGEGGEIVVRIVRR